MGNSPLFSLPSMSETLDLTLATGKRYQLDIEDGISVGLLYPTITNEFLPRHQIKFVTIYKQKSMLHILIAPSSEKCNIKKKKKQIIVCLNVPPLYNSTQLNRHWLQYPCHFTIKLKCVFYKQLIAKADTLYYNPEGHPNQQILIWDGRQKKRLIIWEKFTFISSKWPISCTPPSYILFLITSTSQAETSLFFKTHPICTGILVLSQSTQFQQMSSSIINYWNIIPIDGDI